MGTDTLDGGYDAERLREDVDLLRNPDQDWSKANEAAARIYRTLPALLSALESKDAEIAKLDQECERHALADVAKDEEMDGFRQKLSVADALIAAKDAALERAEAEIARLKAMVDRYGVGLGGTLLKADEIMKAKDAALGHATAGLEGIIRLAARVAEHGKGLHGFPATVAEEAAAALRAARGK